MDIVEKYLYKDRDILKEVLEFLLKQRTWFQDESDSNTVMFATRENGDVGEEKPGRDDQREAIRLARLVKKKFGNTIRINVDSVDEWVHIEITRK